MGMPRPFDPTVEPLNVREGSVFRGSTQDGEQQILRAKPALRDDSSCEIAG